MVEPGADVQHVRSLISMGQARQAVDAAKALYKESATPDREAVLLDAYEVRVRALFNGGFPAEAAAMCGLVVERHAAAAGRFLGIQDEWEVRLGNFRALAPLANPDLPNAQREWLLDLVRCQAWPADLAAWDGLPADHPLRAQARAVATAFERATSGAVTEEDVRLSDLPRRSPLAAWKPLIRAIAAFYRNQDEDCDRHLNSVDPLSGAARLVPAVGTALMPSGRKPGDLVLRITGADPEPLREALRAVDGVHGRSEAGKPVDPREVLRVARSAMEAAKEWPEVNRALPEYLLPWFAMIGIPVSDARKVIDRPVSSANVNRLHALWAEQKRFPAYQVCELWSEFAELAEKGGFEWTGSVQSTLYLHMAELLEGGTLAELREEAILAGSSVLPWFADPGELYRRAAAADGSSEVYRAWVRREKRDGDAKAVDAAALAWSKALPRDAEPLLLLAEAAEERSALQKALKYLSAAEQIDPLNPAVKRSRAVLWQHSAARSMSQGRPDLAAKHIEPLRESEFASHGDLRAMAPVLAWAAASALGDRTAMERENEQIRAVLGVAADVIRTLVASEWDHRLLPAPLPEGLAVDTMARYCTITREFQTAQRMAHDHRDAVIKELAKGNVKTASGELIGLCRTMLAFGCNDVAYMISAAGLARGEMLSRFLLLRAQAVLSESPPRANQVVAAVLQLARAERDVELVERAIHVQRRIPSWVAPSFSAGMETAALSPEHIDAIIAGERAATKHTAQDPGYVRKFAQKCDCPACRRSRGVPPPRAPSRFDAVDDDDDEEASYREGLNEVFNELGSLGGLDRDEAVKKLVEAMEALGVNMPGMPRPRRPQPRRKKRKR